MRNLRFAAMALLLSAATLPALAQSHWAVTNTLHIGGDGGWDYVTVDSANHRLFVTRSTHTQVVDTDSGKLIADIPGQVRSHGVAIAPAANRGFITDGGGSGAILVFDLTTYNVLGKIPTMPDSDGIIYDPGTDLVLAVSGDGNKLMIFNPDIDPKNGKVDTVDLGGAPEFLAADGDGKVYINLANKDQLAVVDLRTNKVIAKWPVAPGGAPTGLALDRKTHRLFIGCRKPAKMIVMSSDDGTVLGDLPIGAGVDATKTDDGLAFASCRDGSLTVAGEKDGKYVVEDTVKTALGARTMGVDGKRHIIYLVTAEYENPSDTTTRRPAMKPDSFMIVEVSRSAAK
jgi:DNA-binding beta-propeller fold protein YncE